MPLMVIVTVDPLFVCQVAVVVYIFLHAARECAHYGLYLADDRPAYLLFIRRFVGRASRDSYGDAWGRRALTVTALECLHGRRAANL